MQRLDERLNASSGVYFDAERLLASHQSPYQRIEVFETPDLGRLMRIDGANMTSDRDEFFYHEALVHPAACAHPEPKRVLIVGGGDGGSSEEALKYSSVALCRMCELDQAVVDMAREWLPNVHRSVFDNPKLDIRIGDGMAYVRATSDRFDLIYLDLTDPVGPAEALYAPPFFADCKRALTPGGALTLHIGSPFSHPQRVQQSLRHLRQLFKVVTPYFVHIPIYGATWGFAVASDAIDISSVGAEEIDARLASRQVAHRQLYTGATHHAMLTLPPYVQALAL